MWYEITNTSAPSKRELKEMKNIVNENLFSNGGQLMYKHHIDEFRTKADIMVMAKYQGHCVGFAFIRKFSESLYVVQLAVANNHKNKGVETSMYDYIKQHSLGFKRLFAHVRTNNNVSQSFHFKNGFVKKEYYAGQNLLVSDIENYSAKTSFNKNKKQQVYLSFNEEEREEI